MYHLMRIQFGFHWLICVCLLFGRDKSVISRHIKNIILENNLDVNQVVTKNATTGNDGKTYIVSFYNLDVIIPLGYKVHLHRDKDVQKLLTFCGGGKINMVKKCLKGG